MDAVKLSYVHQHMKYLTADGDSFILPEKAYKSLGWLNSSGAKPVRILCEFMEPEQRFAAAKVKNTILFFGSARARSAEDHEHATSRAMRVVSDGAASDAEKAQARSALERLSRTKWMTEVYTQVEELARRLTEWSLSRIGADGRIPYIVSTGGGPGLMEAANKGAASVPGAITAGVAISLPFEAGLNKYVTPELGFQMHYFFSRKFALCWPSRALVACPGGYGTLDELMEVLTLLQSGKIDQPDTMPVVLLGASYWRKVVNWDSLEEHGVINRSDIDRLFFTDSVDDAFNYITKKLLEWEVAAAMAALRAAEVAQNTAASAAAAAYAAAAKAAQLAAAQHGSPAPDGTSHAPPPIFTGATALAPAAFGHMSNGNGATSTPAVDVTMLGPPLVLPGRTSTSLTVVPNTKAVAAADQRTPLDGFTSMGSVTGAAANATMVHKPAAAMPTEARKE